MGDGVIERLDARLNEPALAVQGVVTVLVRDARTGAVLERTVQRNVITLAGKRLFLDRWFGVPTPAVVGCAFGDNNTPAAKTDAALYSEQIRLPLTSFTPATDDGTSGKLTAVCVMGSTQGNGNTYREIAFVRSLTSGASDLVNRVVIADKIKTVAKIITVQLDLTLT